MYLMHWELNMFHQNGLFLILSGCNSIWMNLEYRLAKGGVEFAKKGTVP